MIFHSFVHLDGDADADTDGGPGLFRSNVLQFVNDTETHPIVKYKAFIIAFLLTVLGLMILLLFNGERIFNHSFWRHLFIPVSDTSIPTTDAAIFREAVEGMATNQGEVVSADTAAVEKVKKTPCGTDCGQYIDLKGKINDLSKYVDAVKDQKDNIKQTADKLTELGKQIEDLNKSLSPGGQLDIKI